jgi:hypothetical protein
MALNKKLAIAITLSTVTAINTASAGRTYSYPKIYPFAPFATSKIHDDVKRISENENAIINLGDINDKNLSKRKTKIQPWTSTYWPLNKGLIADPYEGTFVGYTMELGTISWTRNYNKFSRRLNGILKNIDKYNSKSLNFLAPSEKYDLLLGDKTFDLTNRLWDYTQKWGNKKEFGFLTNLDIAGEGVLAAAQSMVDFGWYETVDDAFANAWQIQGTLAVDEAIRLVRSGQYSTVKDAMPEASRNMIANSNNFVLEKKNNMIAIWEGICHGWSTAAGIIARPRKTISFQLPDNRSIKFYPSDIKALVSLLWANSMIQDNVNILQSTGKNIGGGVLMQGNRCNLNSPKKDHWGRYYDNKADPFSKDRLPRCVGVHPAIWHLGLVNIIGDQGRSFIVERKVDKEVDNHPMSSYKMTYFNPNTGKSNKRMFKNMVRIDKSDQFRQLRNKDARYIIGVETTMFYLDWTRPNRKFYDSEKEDEMVDKKMYYDLELDGSYNIIGGQWRAVKKGTPTRRGRGNHNQPDFFWVITKKWKDFFKVDTELDPWTDSTQAPPASWTKAALEANDFKYKKNYYYGTVQKCRMINRKTGKSVYVNCEYEDPKPQPLLEVVNKMIELSQ